MNLILVTIWKKKKYKKIYINIKYKVKYLNIIYLIILWIKIIFVIMKIGVFRIKF